MFRFLASKNEKKNYVLASEYDPDCMEDVHENRILLSQNDITPNLALTFGLDVPLVKEENRLHLELTYRSAGMAEFV